MHEIVNCQEQWLARLLAIEPQFDVHPVDLRYVRLASFTDDPFGLMLPSKFRNDIYYVG